MRIVIGRLAIVAFLCGSCLSCGGDAPATSLHPVRGKVSYNGLPAARAVVTLQPEGPPPQTQQGNPIVPMGEADEDGKFTIACTGFGEGAPAGKYKVLIVWLPSGKSPAVKQLMARKKRSSNYDPNSFMPTDPFDGRYSNPAKPVFSADIQPGPNDLSFELKD